MVDRQQVLDALKDREALERVFIELGVDLTEEGDHYKVWCPYHDDSPGSDGEGRPNLSVDSGTTASGVDPGTYHCLNSLCGVGGNIFDFIATHESGKSRKATGPEFKKALDWLADVLQIKEPKKETAKKYTTKQLVEFATGWTNNLLHTDHPDTMHYLRTDRGLSKRVIREFGLGFDDADKRVTIPVYNKSGELTLIRKHKPKPARTEKDAKCINFPKGAARDNPRMNWASGEGEVVHVLRGEMDYLLARRHGFDTADTFVSGESYIPKPEVVADWVGKDVVIWSDHDAADAKGQRAGMVGALKLAAALHKYGCKPFIVDLEGVVEEGEDFTDLVVTHKYTTDMLVALYVDKAVEWEPPDTLPKPTDDTDALALHLADAGNAEYHNDRTKLKVNAFVIGKDMHSYLAPKVVEYTCPTGSGRDGPCPDCPLAQHGGTAKVTLGARNVEMALMVACNDAQSNKSIKAVIGQPAGCPKMHYVVREKQDVEVVRISPEVDDGHRDEYDASASEREAVQHIAFVTGRGVLPNQGYTFTGYVAELADKGVTYTFGEATPLDDMSSPFELGALEHDQLARTFWPAADQSVAEKMEELADDLAANVSHIYGRPTLHIAFDLVWHSLSRGFTFRSEFVDRSYVQAVVVGDTRQGKTQVAERVRKHYRAGRYRSSENLRYTGLIGAVERAGGSGDNWRIKWGIYPQCNGGALTLDEIQELQGGAIAELSTARSSGVASIQKVVAAQAPARVRLFCGANPRDRRALDTYTYGVLALEGLIPTQEDIARFDFGLTVATGDVDTAVLNAEEHPTVEHRATSDLSHLLLRWVWSRPTNAVRFVEDADRLVLAHARTMASTYSAAIPLVDAAEQRVKLARLAAAVACRLFSTDDGEHVLVTPEHVDYAFAYLNRIYTAPSMAYDGYSASHHEEKGLSPELALEIKDALRFVKPGPEWPVFPDTMTHIDAEFTTRTLMENLGIDPDTTRQLIEKLVYFRLVRSVPSPPNSFRKTSRFVAWLRWAVIDAADTPSEPTRKKHKKPVRIG